MSADNWAICPKCKKKVEQARADLLSRVETDYGKIAADEYLALVERSKQPLEIEHTLREDWETGIRQGEFRVFYGAHCETCGFSHEFEHRQPLPKE